MTEIEKSLAWLVTGLINEHFPHPDSQDETEEDDALGTPGCVHNCGPCGALHALSLSGEGRAEVERLVRLTGFQEGGWAFWDDANDRLRWGWFEGWWSRHKACWTNGTESGCHYDEDGNSADPSVVPVSEGGQS